MARASGGDARAMEALWARHRRWVAAVLLTYKPAFEDLEDLLQDVAMTLVGKLGTLREETHFRAWLRVVAVNTARAAGRNGKYRPRPESTMPPRPEPAGDAGSGDPAVAERLRHTLGRLEHLPEGYREPLLLRAVRGLPSREIALTLGIPPATVDTRIARARRMLREDEREEAAAGCSTLGTSR